MDSLAGILGVTTPGVGHTHGAGRNWRPDLDCSNDAKPPLGKMYGAAGTPIYAGVMNEGGVGTSGMIDLKDAATQILIVAAIVSSLRPALAKCVPADLMDWALMALNGLLQAVIVFGTLLFGSGAPITGPAVLGALGQTITIMILTHGGVDVFNRAKKAAQKNEASAPTETQNGLPLNMGG
jgi:hypothetical protein